MKRSHNAGAANPRFVHGMSRSRIYHVWRGMLARCSNPNDPHYHWYGARGISVCERWKKFENFLADMGQPAKGLTLDRFPDNNGNYEPGNCRWATRAEQNRNFRANVWVTINGQQLCVADAAKALGVLRQSIESTARHFGFTPQQAVDHYVARERA